MDLDGEDFMLQQAKFYFATCVGCGENLRFFEDKDGFDATGIAIEGPLLGMDPLLEEEAATRPQPLFRACCNCGHVYLMDQPPERNFELSIGLFPDEFSFFETRQAEFDEAYSAMQKRVKTFIPPTVELLYRIELLVLGNFNRRQISERKLPMTQKEVDNAERLLELGAIIPSRSENA